jgi:hypothetical protein
MKHAEPEIVACRLRSDRTFALDLSDGRTLIVRPEVSPKLAGASMRQLGRFELVGGEGLRWPALDEDLSVRGFLRQAKETPSFVTIVGATTSRRSRRKLHRA